MSRHHLNRSWAVILQQAWAMYFKDRLVNNGFGGGKGGGSSSNMGGVRRKLCFDFNRGVCTFGKRCKFDHRCSFCNKFGHGAYNCRRANKTGSGGNTPNFAPATNGWDFRNEKDRWDRYEKEQKSNNLNNLNNSNNNSDRHK